MSLSSEVIRTCNLIACLATKLNTPITSDWYNYPFGPIGEKSYFAYQIGFEEEKVLRIVGILIHGHL